MAPGPKQELKPLEGGQPHQFKPNNRRGGGGGGKGGEGGGGGAGFSRRIVCETA